MMTRSPGFSSTLRAMTASLSWFSRSFRKTVNGRLKFEQTAASIFAGWGSAAITLTEQLEDRLVRLRSQRQRRDRKLLAGLQRQHVGAFQVGVDEREPIGAGPQGIDHVVGEVLAVLHDRQVRAEGRGLAGHCI